VGPQPPGAGHDRPPVLAPPVTASGRTENAVVAIVAVLGTFQIS
jgi:hypothetical protein